jgi:cellulose synthase/poly-beta-1,6-N-acetylglucosamine synthase-like glycosyltransferase
MCSRTSDTLVAPTFNERQTIGPSLDGLLSLPERFDVLIVDDRSCDGTAEYLTARAATEPRLRLNMPQANSASDRLTSSHGCRRGNTATRVSSHSTLTSRTIRRMSLVF